jgi:hypothetical protein
MQVCEEKEEEFGDGDGDDDDMLIIIRVSLNDRTCTTNCVHISC